MSSIETLVDWKLYLFIGLQVMDIITTRSNLRRGHVEKNPLMKGVVENLAVFVAVKIGYVWMLIGTGWWLLEHYDPIWTTILLVAVNAFYGYIVIWNNMISWRIRK